MVRRLPVKETIAGSIPAAAAGCGMRIEERRTRKEDGGSRIEDPETKWIAKTRFFPLQSSIFNPLSSFFPCPWPIGEGTGLPNQRGGFDSHRALSGIG